jgi:hypothetical protein
MRAGQAACLARASLKALEIHENGQGTRPSLRRLASNPAVRSKSGARPAASTRGNAMTRARTILLFVVGVALGAWALLGINDAAKTAEPPTNAPTAQPSTPAPATPAPAGQGTTTGGAPAQPQARQPQAGGGQSAAGGGGNPQDIAKSAEKGSLKSPYQDSRKLQRKATRNSWELAATAVTAEQAVAAWVRL